MPTLKPVIRTSHPTQDEKYNIKIRVTHHRKVRYIKTDYHVIEDDFDHAAGCVVKGTMKPEHVDRINNRLTILLGQYAMKIENYRDKIENMDITNLMKILREKREVYDFLAVLDDRIKDLDSMNKEMYRDSFRNTRRLITTYSKTMELPFEIITQDWLKKFETHLKLANHKTNSIGHHMRNIRTIYNQAITMGLASYESYPFRGYKIPKERTRKRNITAEQIVEIIHYDSNNKLNLWARDMFMLSFYLIGINTKDMMFLEEIEDGRVFYQRFKGKKQYSIKVLPEAQEIFDRYPGKKYLLNTLDKYSHYRAATKRINKKLKTIAEDINDRHEQENSKFRINTNITSYFARHSWATLV